MRVLLEERDAALDVQRIAGCHPQDRLMVRTVPSLDGEGTNGRTRDIEGDDVTRCCLPRSSRCPRRQELSGEARANSAPSSSSRCSSRPRCRDRSSSHSACHVPPIACGITLPGTLHCGQSVILDAGLPFPNLRGSDNLVLRRLPERDVRCQRQPNAGCWTGGAVNSVSLAPLRSTPRRLVCSRRQADR